MFNRLAGRRGGPQRDGGHTTVATIKLPSRRRASSRAAAAQKAASAASADVLGQVLYQTFELAGRVGSRWQAQRAAVRQVEPGADRREPRTAVVAPRARGPAATSAPGNASL